MAWPDTDVFQFVLMQFQGTFTDVNQEWRNSFHLWGHDAASPVTADDLAGLGESDAMDDLVTAYQALMDTDTALDGVLLRTVEDPQDPTAPGVEYFRSAPVSGAVSTGGHTPTEMCMLLKEGSDAANRSSHGHVFLPIARDGGGYTGELWDTGQADLCAQLIDGLTAFMYTAGDDHASGAAEDFDLALYSPTQRAADLEQYGYRVVSVAVDRRIRWLRSRGKGS